MTGIPPEETQDPSGPSVPSPEPSPGGSNPWPLFPEKKVAPDIPPPSVGFFKRALAFFMDLVLVEWITVFFVFISLSAREAALGGGTAGILSEGMDRWGLFHSPSWTLVFLVYFSFFGFYGGQTPGKMFFRFRVVMKNGGELSVYKALVRTLGYFMGFLTLGLGFFAAAVTPSGRALHDFLSGTRVEKKHPD